jgi:hypothetical protein
MTLRRFSLLTKVGVCSYWKTFSFACIPSTHFWIGVTPYTSLARVEVSGVRGYHRRPYMHCWFDVTRKGLFCACHTDKVKINGRAT